MATDPVLLLQSLGEYDAALGRHIERLRDSFDQLTNAWSSLHGHYQGTSAEQFAEAYAAAARGFKNYMEGAENMQAVLRVKAGQLRQYDQHPVKF